MRGLSALPRALLLTAAALFAAVIISYGAGWMYYIGKGPAAFLGVEFETSPDSGPPRLIRIESQSAAERAGLRPGDRLTHVNGSALKNLNPFHDAVARGRPGDEVAFTVERPGTEGALTLRAVLGPFPAGDEPPPTAQRIVQTLIRAFPVLFLMVSLPVLFLRLRDPHAWLLALLFAVFIGGAPVLTFEPVIDPALRGAMMAGKVTLAGLAPSIFYAFFAVFPEPSPLHRRLPALRWVLLAPAALVVAPLSVLSVAAGGSGLLRRLETAVGTVPVLDFAVSAYTLGGFALGLVALVWNAVGAPTVVARRKCRVIVWGTVIGLTPFLTLQAVASASGRSFYQYAFWVWAPTVLAVLLVPISFAYAVVVHRVLEIPVLLRRSARYFLVQRGFVALLVLLSLGMAVEFAIYLGPALRPQAEAALPMGVGLGAVFGVLLLWAGSRVQKRVGGRIDRAFFRSAYDARQILQDLAERCRTAATRDELASLLAHHLDLALRPEELVIYFTAGASLIAARGQVPPAARALAATLPVLEELRRRGQPWDVPPAASGPDGALGPLARMRPECLVPILGRDARLAGLVALGRRLSEEPYSGEDRRLLATAASQVGVALDSIALAEQMAERLDSERRSAQEMEIARQVQRKLFPQKTLPLATLEYVADCIQARAVGGDFYDFLDLGPGRVALVQADISGKGMAAALLMANLQASLRSRSALALDDLPRLLQSVNRLLHDSTEMHHYATLFLGRYEDAGRRLDYANCGHNPPILLRAGDAVERLRATATVVGMFEEWVCPVASVRLDPGDVLVIFSDGVTEAMRDDEEFFGDGRLIDLLRTVRDRPVQEIFQAVIAAVTEFSGREQEDDITLLVARAR